MGRKNTLAQQIRDAGRGLYEFSVEDLSIPLNIQTRAGLRSLQNRIRDLRKCVDIEHVGRGKYRLTERASVLTVEGRILRAMSASGTFTTRDLARIADCDRSYARVIIRRLESTGDLEYVGKVKGPNNKPERSYRVRHAGDFYLKHVKRG